MQNHMRNAGVPPFDKPASQQAGDTGDGSTTAETRIPFSNDELVKHIVAFIVADDQVSSSLNPPSFQLIYFF